MITGHASHQVGLDADFWLTLGIPWVALESMIGGFGPKLIALIESSARLESDSMELNI